ncbi:MAG: hypothetical protein KHX29_11020 [Prevotella buccalis]|nr:hypothetical protein [Hoylesella buccalis]
MPWAIRGCPCGAYYLTTSHSNTIQSHYFTFQHHTASLLHIPTPYNLTTSHSNTILPHYFTFQHHTISLLHIPTPYSLTTSHSSTIQPHYFAFQHHTTSLLRIPTQQHTTSIYLHVNTLVVMAGDVKSNGCSRTYTDASVSFRGVPWP